MKVKRQLVLLPIERKDELLVDPVVVCIAYVPFHGLQESHWNESQVWLG